MDLKNNEIRREAVEYINTALTNNTVVFILHLLFV